MDDIKNIIGCEFNDDNGCVEVAYKDGNFLKIKWEEGKKRFGQRSSH